MIIKHKLNSLPIDLSKILRGEKIAIVTYQAGAEALALLDKDLTTNNLGFSLKINNEFYIFYNGSVSETLQRFTIAHEIGHIKLKHFFTGNHDSDEKEANMFAARLLMPMCILYECHVGSAEEISALCKVSYTAARFRYQRLQMLKNWGRFYASKHEVKVKILFAKFIEDYRITKH